MQTYLLVANLVLAFLIVPVFGYVIRLERRLTRVETIIGARCSPWDGKERRRKT